MDPRLTPASINTHSAQLLHDVAAPTAPASQPAQTPPAGAQTAVNTQAQPPQQPAQPPQQPLQPAQTPPSAPTPQVQIPVQTAQSAQVLVPTTHSAAVPSPVAAPVSVMAPEFVDTIPLRQPGQSQPTAVPVHSTAPAPVSQPAQPAQTPPPADDLERILQAVNNKVKAPTPAQTPKSKLGLNLKFSAPPIAAKLAAKLKPTKGISKPIGVMVAAAAVFTALAFTAIFAYHQGSKTKLVAQPGKVGTSYTASSAIQEAGGLLVRPSDLDDYSQALQTKMNSLNDSQDFSSNPISDQMLGL